MRSVIACGVALLSAFALAGCESPAAAESETPIPTFGVPLAKSHTGCGTWSCSIADCGYDTATDPRGACCMAPPPEGEQGSWEKPSCASGKLAVSSEETSCWSGSGCHGLCVDDVHVTGDEVPVVNGPCGGAVGWWHCTSASFGSC